MNFSPSIFEAIMLICFGAAWPFSIFEMLKTKKAKGKSVKYVVIILIGYIAGMFFQYLGARNAIFFLYLFNTLLVVVDLTLTLKYRES